MAVGRSGLSVPARFINRLASTFDTNVGTDLTIVRRNARWRVHKTLLCQHSPVFEDMLQGQVSLIVGSQKDELELPDDDQHAKKMLLKYMYNFEYIPEKSGHSHISREETSGHLDDILPHMEVIRVVDKYDMPELLDIAADYFRLDCLELTGCQVVIDAMEEAYTGDWPDRLREEVVNIVLGRSELYYDHIKGDIDFFGMAERVPKLLADVMRAGELMPKED